MKSYEFRPPPPAHAAQDWPPGAGRLPALVHLFLWDGKPFSEHNRGGKGPTTKHLAPPASAALSSIPWQPTLGTLHQRRVDGRAGCVASTERWLLSLSLSLVRRSLGRTHVMVSDVCCCRYFVDPKGQMCPQRLAAREAWLRTWRRARFKIVAPLESCIMTPKRNTWSW